MRTKRSFQYLLTGFSASVVTMVTSLVAMPWLLRWINAEQFGTYRVVMDWVGYLVILEFGLSEAMIPLITQSIGKGNELQLRKVLVVGVHSFFWIVIVKLFVGGIFVGVATYLIPISVWQQTDLRIACLVGVIGSVFSPIQPFRVLLESKQLGYLINLFLIIQGLLITGLSLFFAWSGVGITGQLMAILIGGIPLHIFLLAHALMNYHGLWRQLCFDSGDPEIRRSLWSLSRPQFIAHICSRVSFMTDNIIIAFMLNPANVAGYFITQRLISVVQAQLYHIGSATWAPLRELQVQGDNSFFIKHTIELSRLTVILGIIALGPIVAFNYHFITLWVGENHYAGLGVTFFAAVNAIPLALISLWSWNFGSAGLAQKLVPQYIIFTVINFISSVVFTRLFGLPGPLMGTLIANLSVSLWIIPRHLKIHFGVHPYALFSAIMRPVFILAPIAFFVYAIALRSSNVGWLGLILWMTFSTFIFSGASWFLVLTEQERREWKIRFLSLFSL